MLPQGTRKRLWRNDSRNTKYENAKKWENYFATASIIDVAHPIWANFGDIRIFHIQPKLGNDLTHFAAGAISRNLVPYSGEL